MALKLKDTRPAMMKIKKMGMDAQVNVKLRRSEKLQIVKFGIYQLQQQLFRLLE